MKRAAFHPYARPQRRGVFADMPQDVPAYATGEIMGEQEAWRTRGTSQQHLQVATELTAACKRRQMACATAETAHCDVVCREPYHLFLGLLQHEEVWQPETVADGQVTVHMECEATVTDRARQALTGQLLPDQLILTVQPHGHGVGNWIIEGAQGLHDMRRRLKANTCWTTNNRELLTRTTPTGTPPGLVMNTDLLSDTRWAGRLETATHARQVVRHLLDRVGRVAQLFDRAMNPPQMNFIVTVVRDDEGDPAEGVSVVVESNRTVQIRGPHAPDAVMETLRVGERVIGLVERTGLLEVVLQHVLGGAWPWGPGRVECTVYCGGNDVRVPGRTLQDLL